MTKKVLHLPFLKARIKFLHTAPSLSHLNVAQLDSDAVRCKVSN